jgi:hypothetical protein
MGGNGGRVGMERDATHLQREDGMGQYGHTYLYEHLQTSADENPCGEAIGLQAVGRNHRLCALRNHRSPEMAGHQGQTREDERNVV